MGADKALLPLGQQTMAQHVSRNIATVAHPVCLVGDPALYGHLGITVQQDQIADRGPLSGCEAALLSDVAADWNLIVACDLPYANPELFQSLAKTIERTRPGTDCIIPQHGGKLEPLCAIYHRRCGPIASLALARGKRRVVDWIGMLQAEFWPVENLAAFQNVNTPSDWDRFLNER